MDHRLITLALSGALLAGLAGMTPGARAEPVAYSLDPSHSFASFELLHFDTSTLRGRVQVVVDTEAASTGPGVLDARIKQDDMLTVAVHPQAFFVAERFEFDAQGNIAAVTGEFTLRGSSQPLRLVAKRFRCYLNPLFRREVCGGDFEAEFSRSSFGISHSLPFVSDVVRLKIAVEAIRQTP